MTPGPTAGAGTRHPPATVATVRTRQRLTPWARAYLYTVAVALTFAAFPRSIGRDLGELTRALAAVAAVGLIALPAVTGSRPRATIAGLAGALILHRAAMFATTGAWTAAALWTSCFIGLVATVGTYADHLPERLDRAVPE